MAWALVAVGLACGSAVVLAGAVRALVEEPSFAAVLRLSVEAIAAVVVSGAAWRRTDWSRRRRRERRGSGPGGGPCRGRGATDRGPGERPPPR